MIDPKRVEGVVNAVLSSLADTRGNFDLLMPKLRPNPRRYPQMFANIVLAVTNQPVAAFGIN
jgi:hypothetical protein